MSVESLKARRSVAWVDEKYSIDQFGPPLYDETTRSYMWRIFKRGFTWGKKTTQQFSCIGFMLTSAVMFQYQYVIFLLRGGLQGKTALSFLT